MQGGFDSFQNRPFLRLQFPTDGGDGLVRVLLDAHLTEPGKQIGEHVKTDNNFLVLLAGNSGRYEDAEMPDFDVTGAHDHLAAAFGFLRRCRIS